MGVVIALVTLRRRALSGWPDGFVVHAVFFGFSPYLCVVVVACVVTSLCCVTFCDGDVRGVEGPAPFGNRKVGLSSVRVRGDGATVLCKGQWEATPRNGSGNRACHTS